MELYFVKSEVKKIEGKEYCKITLLDMQNVQLFNFYTLVNEKSYNFVKDCKTFSNVTDKICFVIKRNNKISFDIK